MKEEILFSAKQVNGIRRRPRLTIKGIHKPFCLNNIDFELPKGYIMGLIGKNGAGKTTFFDYIMNRKLQYTGEFLLEGKEIHSNHLWMLDNVGFVSEANEFMDLRTAIQNAQMLGRFYSGFSIELFEQQMEGFKVSCNKTVGKMSRGEYVKFQLAFAVAHKPVLLLLDEATAGMDPVFRIDFYGFLHNLIKDESCSVIMSTHVNEEIERHADYVIMLEDGRMNI